MNSKTGKKNHGFIQDLKDENENSSKKIKSDNNSQSNNQEVEDLCDENLTSLKKIHAILLNCSNLSKNQKLEFCESERYFMKLYLRQLKEKDL